MTTTFLQTSAATNSAPKHLYRVAETALGTLTAPSEEAMLRAIGDRMVEQFAEACGVRGWALVSEPFETDLCFGELGLAEQLVSGSHRDDVDVLVWSLRGEREWRLAFRLASPPDENASLLLHLSHVAAQQLVSESGWRSSTGWPRTAAAPCSRTTRRCSSSSALRSSDAGIAKARPSMGAGG